MKRQPVTAVVVVCCRGVIWVFFPVVCSSPGASSACSREQTISASLPGLVWGCFHRERRRSQTISAGLPVLVRGGASIGSVGDLFFVTWFRARGFVLAPLPVRVSTHRAPRFPSSCSRVPRRCPTCWSSCPHSRKGRLRSRMASCSACYVTWGWCDTLCSRSSRSPTLYAESYTKY